MEGSLSLLEECTRDAAVVLISCRNNRKLLCRIKAFDRHFNLLLENVREIWYETKNGVKEEKERFLSKLFVRGDGVVMVVRAPDDLKI
jgi:small nuclear ribonucleoprotein D2